MTLSARRAWQVRLVLATVTLAAYSVALTSPFQFDDRGVVQNGAAFDQGLRPLLRLSYALSWGMGGGATWPFHAFNLLLHLLGIELVMRLHTAATKPERAFPFAALSTGGVVAGALFALHPLQTEAVTYVTGRSSSQAAVLLLLALLLYVGGTRERRWFRVACLAPLAFLAALATKETSVGFPFVLLAWEVLVERSAPSVVVRRVAPWLLLTAALVGAVLMHPRFFALVFFSLGQRDWLESGRLTLGGLGHLFERLALVGLPCIDPGLWLPPSALQVGLAAALSVALLGGVARWGTGPMRFGVTLFFLQTAVLHLLLPRTDVMNERHAYLGNAGLFLALGAVLARVRRPAWLGAGAAVLALLTLRRNWEYRTPVSLWESTVRSAAHNPRAHNNLGAAYELAGDRERASARYREALRLAPHYAAARQNLARVR